MSKCVKKQGIKKPAWSGIAAATICKVTQMRYNYVVCQQWTSPDQHPLKFFRLSVTSDVRTNFRRMSKCAKKPRCKNQPIGTYLNVRNSGSSLQRKTSRYTRWNQRIHNGWYVIIVLHRINSLKLSRFEHLLNQIWDLKRWYVNSAMHMSFRNSGFDIMFIIVLHRINSLKVSRYEYLSNRIWDPKRWYVNTAMHMSFRNSGFDILLNNIWDNIEWYVKIGTHMINNHLTQFEGKSKWLLFLSPLHDLVCNFDAVLKSNLK
jgi:hypothetical protein